MLFLFILVLSLICQIFLPWWIIVPIAMGAAFWKANTGKHAFTTGFFAIFCLWILAGLFYSIPNENILANRVGELLKIPLGSFNWLIVLLLAALIGGIVAGVAALTGRYIREATIRKV